MPVVPPRINLVTLGVADVARATGFYEGLGRRLSPASVPGVVSFFDLDSCVLGLWSAVAGAGVLRPAGDAEEFGDRSGYFADPDGHPWEVAHNAGSTLDAAGRVQLP